MRRTSRGAGWRAWRQHAQATLMWHPEFEAKKRKPDKSEPGAPYITPYNAGPNIRGRNILSTARLKFDRSVT